MIRSVEATQILTPMSRPEACADLGLAWGMAGAIPRIHPMWEQLSFLDGGV